MSDRPIWVTGSAGMIGSAVVGKLIAKGENVLILDNFSRGRPEFVHPKARLAGVDLSQPVPLELLKERPKAIVHMGARVGGVAYMMSDQILSHRNAAVDWNVIEAALFCDAALLYCSTACIYPVSIQTKEWLKESGNVQLREDDATSGGAEPESIYGWCKLVGELTVAAHAKENPQAKFKIVRMFNAYGPNEVPSKETGHVIPALIYKILCGKPPLEVWGDGTALRAFTYVDDCADGILTVMEKGTSGRPYNIGTSETISIGDLAKLILKVIGIPDAEGKIIRFDPAKPQGVFGRSAVVDRALTEIGWSPRVSLEDGIRLTVSWCKEWLMGTGEWKGAISHEWMEPVKPIPDNALQRERT